MNSLTLQASNSFTRGRSGILDIPQHLYLIASRARVQPLDDCTDITEDAGIHQR